MKDLLRGRAEIRMGYKEAQCLHQIVVDDPRRKGDYFYLAIHDGNSIAEVIYGLRSLVDGIEQALVKVPVQEAPCAYIH